MLSNAFFHPPQAIVAPAASSVNLIIAQRFSAGTTDRRKVRVLPGRKNLEGRALSRPINQLSPARVRFANFIDPRFFLPHRRGMNPALLPEQTTGFISRLT